MDLFNSWISPQSGAGAAAFFAAGLVLLGLGGHFLIHWTLHLSRRFRLKPVFLSVVILGMGTSAPEWFVTTGAAFKGYSDAALGNVIGSNIANILLILGGVGVFCLQPEEEQTKRLSLPFLLSSFACLFFLGLDGALSRPDAVLALGLFAVYLKLLVKNSRRKEAGDLQQKQAGGGWKAAGGVLLGFLLLFAGSELTVQGAVSLGRGFGLSERFVGLFLISIGTSLPEGAAAVAGLIKKQKEMVLGNIAGSNIFNTLFVLGSAALVRPLEDCRKFFPDFLWMSGAAAALTAALFVFKKLPRGGAFLFVSSYILYISLFYPAAGRL